MRQVICHWCDDIRLEVNNKVSLIGIYGRAAYCPTFPVIFPKICIALYCTTSIDHPFKDLNVKVMSDNKVTYEERIADSDLRANQEQILKSAKEKSVTRILIQLQMALTSFILEKPAIYEVIVESEGETYMAGRLNFTSDKEG